MEFAKTCLETLLDTIFCILSMSMNSSNRHAITHQQKLESDTLTYLWVRPSLGDLPVEGFMVEVWCGAANRTVTSWAWACFIMSVWRCTTPRLERRTSCRVYQSTLRTTLLNQTKCNRPQKSTQPSKNLTEHTMSKTDP